MGASESAASKKGSVVVVQDLGFERPGVELLAFRSSAILVSMSVNAFHEKAGRSQVDLLFFIRKLSLGRVITLSPSFHPHSR